MRASGGAMAAAVTNGGGFGFLAAGYDSEEKFSGEINAARAALTQPHKILPIGIGFLAWQLESHLAKREKEPKLPGPLDLLRLALESRVRAVWFAFGEHVGQWVEHVRKYDADKGDGHKTIVFVQIFSSADARIAMTDWNADVIVAQGREISPYYRLQFLIVSVAGNESGGHGYGAAPTLFTLLSSIIALSKEDGPPILGAGGLANGAHVASLLTLGADGAVLGTRFLLTPESLYTDAQRKALLSATDSSTKRTMSFDTARGTLGWPRGVDGRALYNATIEDFDKGVGIEEVKAKFLAGVAQGDPDRMLVWAGTGVGLMSEIKPAKDVVEEIHRDIIERLRISSRLVI
ncbi:hypothetical protein HWV62_14708 [Athelia sp. TMB]|nr:hypothetical protein HWV62_14708 [Athelia sp. TMB]